MRKRLIAAALALCFALTLVTPAWAAEDDVPTSGSCGENATWTLSPDGTLTISGTGGAVKPQGGFPKEVAHAVRSVIH